MENEQAAESFLALLNFTHALTGLGGGVVTLFILGLIGKALLAKFREGMVSNETFDKLVADMNKKFAELKDDKGEYIFLAKDDFEDVNKEQKDYIMRIDKKEQKTRGAVQKLAGHAGVDLPELAD